MKRQVVAAKVAVKVIAKVKRLRPWALPNKALAGTRPARGSVPLDLRYASRGLTYG